MIVLTTSHLSIHTWPKENDASLDFYTCGEHDPLSQADFSLKGFQAKRDLFSSGYSNGLQLVIGQEVMPFELSKPSERLDR